MGSSRLVSETASYLLRRAPLVARAFVGFVVLGIVVSVALAQPAPEQSPEAAAPAEQEQGAAGQPAPVTDAEQPIAETAASGEATEEPEIIEDIVDQALRAADLPAAGNTPTHFAIAAGFVVLALILRVLVVKWIFRLLTRLANRTSWDFDNYVIPAIEGSVKTLILLMGVVGALKVLKLPPAAERALEIGYTIVFSLVALVFFLRLASALLDHLQAKARARQLNVVAFMPWIKRIVLALIFVFGVLMIAQSLGANVRAFLAGLGIGGLAVALAAQDTLANIFGSIIIAIDQPFRLGEFVQIGSNSGSVEDIGLRSTRLRTAQKNLITIPNKTVAAEPIVNLTRFVQRRVEQTVGLTYDATPEQLEGLVEDIRGILQGEEEVDTPSIMVAFTELAASSLNVWVVYNSRDPDFQKLLRLRQRINVSIMRAVAARGLKFAFPSQSLYVETLPKGTMVPAAPNSDQPPSTQL